MSQHKIVGSEAFDRKPYVLVRGLKPGSFRRRRARTVLLLTLGALAGAVAAAVIVVLMLTAPVA